MIGVLFRAAPCAAAPATFSPSLLIRLVPMIAIPMLLRACMLPRP